MKLFSQGTFCISQMLALIAFSLILFSLIIFSFVIIVYYLFNVHVFFFFLKAIKCTTLSSVTFPFYSTDNYYLAFRKKESVWMWRTDSSSIIMLTIDIMAKTAVHMLWDILLVPVLEKKTWLDFNVAHWWQWQLWNGLWHFPIQMSSYLALILQALGALPEHHTRLPLHADRGCIKLRRPWLPAFDSVRHNVLNSG